MRSGLQRKGEMSFPILERNEKVVSILDLPKDLTDFIFSRAREVFGAQELGITTREWAHVLGVTDRMVRLWRSGLQPLHKRYILSVAKAAQDYCKRARARIDSIQEWAEQVVIMSTVDGFKEGKNK